jgi:PAS domain S-box-containing protein
VFWLAASLAIRLTAFGWSSWIALRRREWRLGLLAALLGVATVRLLAISWTNGFTPRPDSIEATGALISLLALAAVSVMERIYSGERSTQAALTRRDEALERVSDLYALVAEHSSDIIWTLNVDGSVGYVSPAVERILGYTPEEHRERPPEEVLTPASLELANRLFQRAAEEGVSEYRYEAEHLTRDGGSVWCEVSTVLVRDAGGRIRRVIGATRDISERKEADAHREQLQSELLQAQKMEAVGQLAGGIAHDFNNHLTVILGFAEQLAEELGEQTRARSMVEDMTEAAERSAALTRKLLAFSRRQVVQPRIVDVNRLIRDLEPMLRRLIGEDIEMRLDLARDLGRVLADPAQLEQVVVNLAVNARDAMPHGGAITIATRSHAAPGRGGLAIEVSDTGTGMDEATLARVFEPFFTTKPEGHGTGLGLSTVYGISRQLGGEVSALSRPGHGSCFELRLSLAEGEEAVSDTSAAESALTGSETVLVVDDSELVRRFVRKAFESRGYRVLEAADGHEALGVVDTRPGVELVIADVIMPRLGGVELARELAGRPEAPAVLLMSGYAEAALDGRTELPGAARFLQKPFGAHELLGAARDVLDQDA